MPRSSSWIAPPLRSAPPHGFSALSPIPLPYGHFAPSALPAFPRVHRLHLALGNWRSLFPQTRMFSPRGLWFSPSLCLTSLLKCYFWVRPSLTMLFKIANHISFCTPLSHTLALICCIIHFKIVYHSFPPLEQ